MTLQNSLKLAQFEKRTKHLLKGLGFSIEPGQELERLLDLIAATHNEPGSIESTAGEDQVEQVVDADQCLAVAKAIDTLGISQSKVAGFFNCAIPSIKKSYNGGDYPKWYYGIASGGTRLASRIASAERPSWRT